MINTRLITKEDFTKVTKEVNRFGEKVTINPIDTIETVGLLKDYKKVKSKAAYIYFTGVEVEGDIGQGIYMRKDYDGYHDRGVKLNIKGTKYIRLYNGTVYPEWFNENFAKALKDAAVYTNIQLLPKTYQLKSKVSLDIQELHIDMNGATIECIDNAFNFNLGIDSILEITNGTIVAPNNAFKLNNLGRAKYVDCRTMMRYPTGIAPDTNGILTDGSLVEINSIKKFTQPITVVNEVDSEDSLVTNNYIASNGIEGTIVRINKDTTAPIVTTHTEPVILSDIIPNEDERLVNKNYIMQQVDYIANAVVEKNMATDTLSVPGSFYIQYANPDTGLFEEKDEPGNLFPGALWRKIRWPMGHSHPLTLGVGPSVSNERPRMPKLKGSMIEFADRNKPHPFYIPETVDLHYSMPEKATAVWPVNYENDKEGFIATRNKANNGFNVMQIGGEVSPPGGTTPFNTAIIRTSFSVGEHNDITPASLPVQVWYCLDTNLTEEDIANIVVTPNPIRAKVNAWVTVNYSVPSNLRVEGWSLSTPNSYITISGSQVRITQVAEGEVLAIFTINKNGVQHVVKKKIQVEGLMNDIVINANQWTWDGVTWANPLDRPVAFRIKLPIIEATYGTTPRADEVSLNGQQRHMRTIYYTIRNDTIGESTNEAIRIENGNLRIEALEGTRDLQNKEVCCCYGQAVIGFDDSRAKGKMITDPWNFHTSIKYTLPPGQTIRIRLQMLEKHIGINSNIKWWDILPLPPVFSGSDYKGTCKLLRGDPITIMFE